ncbi:hypothetical protein COU78_02815 [Candidatus Peregrinibacteria bacterium CG10_big_fil_rev_8_21_14_0_10_49_24]|nr:MAG: hypothetical protein COV83_02795 [Candidatus Peregrinibacteria bacterium CG11_big_fil_rev_8_21_14_0_20_49_14]PIR51065.1 MAG: hypothetical protein COU78_02815 [Candidatus Peregrinibacteria bacterium CG10_big_fil_rev_8_21_14_0_10_49_24]PJA67618.1 MAG: hypothetical protein CO157_04295 [Candidatus Peregrinibacteria bacterium CG_4_9_14_3_um_filter_49_12]
MAYEEKKMYANNSSPCPKRKRSLYGTVIDSTAMKEEFMRMGDSFQQKAARLQDDMLLGKTGCIFGKEAAEKGAVTYASVETGNERGELLRNLSSFFANQQYRVLALIPNNDPATYEDGRDLALEIYHDLLLALRSVNTLLLDDFVLQELTSGSTTDVGAMADELPRQQMSPESISHALRDAGIRKDVCNSFGAKGFLALNYLNTTAKRVELLIPFAMGRYYKPLKPGTVHPRYAENFAVILTYYEDIKRVLAGTDCKEKVGRTKAWQKETVGYAYNQGYHIPQIPEKHRSEL